MTWLSFAFQFLPRDFASVAPCCMSIRVGWSRMLFLLSNFWIRFLTSCNQFWRGIARMISTSCLMMRIDCPWFFWVWALLGGYFDPDLFLPFWLLGFWVFAGILWRWLACFGRCLHFWRVFGILCVLLYVCAFWCFGRCLAFLLFVFVSGIFRIFYLFI